MYGATSPRFVRRFRQLGGEITAAAKEYVAAVREGSVPAQEHSFAMAPGEKAPQA
jgi:ketopantoate hydroxymethyltransferase